MRLSKLLIEDDFNIKNHTSFKIGGKIKRVYFPETSDEFADVLKSNPKIKVVGNLSDTLVSSFGYDNDVISTIKLNDVKISGRRISAAAGVKGPKLSQLAAEKGLTGLEFMIGFPGSVGGEVFMNAGAHGQCIADCIKFVKVFDGCNIITLTKDEMGFAYRKSACEDKGYTVIEAEFELENADIENVKRKITENLEFRKQHQPSLILPNCGSVFKNPENMSAGKLLDECGVKGLRVGGAKVWDGHANFIVNENNAASNDVLELMAEMKKRVEEKFGLELMPEIRFLGGNNKDEVELCRYLKVK